MAPNPDLLRTEFLGVTVRFEPVELKSAELAGFFAAVSGRYGLTRLELLPEGGATMSGADGAELVVRRDLISSSARTPLGVGEAARRVVSLLAEAVECHDTGPLWIEDVSLVAVWDCGDGAAARELMAEDVLRFDRERAALLGDEGLSLGLRAWRRMGDGTLDLALEPMHEDPGRLYVRMTYAQPDPVEPADDLAAVKAAVQGLGEYLYGPLMEFVLALARR